MKPKTERGELERKKLTKEGGSVQRVVVAIRAQNIVYLIGEMIGETTCVIDDK